MRIWLFAFAVVVALALFSLDGLLGGLFALAWAFIVFPHGAAWVIRRISHDDRAVEPPADYWRTGRWQSGVH